MINRREFLTSSAASLAYLDDTPKRVALIGAGWYGKCDLFRLIQVAPVEVVSVCDVDKNMLADAADRIAERQKSKKRPRTYGDYRKLLAERDIDIAIVGTPDHWHALPTIEAIKAGAHVWVQKPISVDVVEGQAMLAAARKYKKVVQVGMQRRSTPHVIEARNLIRDGKLGKIGVIETCCFYPRNNPPNPPDTAPPDYLDYEMWTGPAPMRPFNRLTHPGSWRAFNEYGNGTIGDMGVHMIDMARWMMDLGWPKTISASGGVLVHKNAKQNIADTQIATLDFGDVKMTWQHRHYGVSLDEKYPWAAIFYGEKGTLKASVWGYDFIPREKGAEAVHKDVEYELEQYPEDKTEPRLEKHCAPAIRRQMQNFLNSIATGSRPVADIEEGHISAASCILSNLSMQLGRSLEWDAAAGQVKGDAAANKLLARPYRKPWVHPDPKTV
jgi:predicted dehydrogenase